MPGLAWTFVLIVTAGVLAFALARRFGGRAGGWVVAGVAVLTLPRLIAHGYALFRRPDVDTALYLPPVDSSSLGASGYLALGALAFAVILVLSASLGAYLGTRKWQGNAP